MFTDICLPHTNTSQRERERDKGIPTYRGIIIFFYKCVVLLSHWLCYNSSNQKSKEKNWKYKFLRQCYIYQSFFHWRALGISALHKIVVHCYSHKGNVNMKRWKYLIPVIFILSSQIIGYSEFQFWELVRVRIIDSN